MRRNTKWLVVLAVGVGLYVVSQRKAAVAAAVRATIPPDAGAMSTAVSPTGAPTTANMQALAGTLSPGFLPGSQREIDMRRAASMDGLSDIWTNYPMDGLSDLPEDYPKRSDGNGWQLGYVPPDLSGLGAGSVFHPGARRLPFYSRNYPGTVSRVGAARTLHF